MSVTRCTSEEFKPIELSDLNGLRVLIADGNETNRRILYETVLGWGCNPLAVADGRSALDELTRAAEAGQRFGFVLLDHQLADLDGFAVAAEIRARENIAKTVILLLSSLGQVGYGSTARSLGVRSLLTKPVRQSVLLEQLLRHGARAKAFVAGLPEVPSGPSVPPRNAAPNGAGEKAATPLRILLAEDNPVNQIVATAILQSRGHDVTVVGDGLAAVEKSGVERFDLILMDVQMPVMDGRAATQAIRSRELLGGERLPIIALTASAMEDDAKQCLEAGMDDFLSKPIQIAEFIEMVERRSAVALR